MRQLFASYDDYRKVVDELENCLGAKINEREQEKLRLQREADERELNEKLQSIIDWAINNNISARRLPRNVRDLLQLTDLKLGYDKEDSCKELKSLPEHIGVLKNLKSFRVMTINTIKIPKSFMSLSKLEVIELRLSGLRQELPNDLSGFTNLKQLKLVGKNIIFDNLVIPCNLEYIAIIGSSLSKLPEELKFMKNLTTLFLSENNFTEIPNVIGYIDSLEYLSFSKNNIKNLPNFIINLKKLKALHLGNNNLIEINDCIGDLLSLEYLDISQNTKLVKISHRLYDLPNLRKIFVFQNPNISLYDRTKIEAKNFMGMWKK